MKFEKFVKKAMPHATTLTIDKAYLPTPDAITKEQFEEAYMQVIEEMINDPQLTGMNKLAIPLIGSIFANKMEVILFGKEQKED